MLHALLAFDRWLFLVINHGLGRPWLDGLMLGLSSLGSWPIGLVTLAILSDAGRQAFWRTHARALLLGVAIALPINPQLKLLVNRDRPRGYALAHASTEAFTVRSVEKTHKHGSFPSGHSAAAFFFMTYAALYRPSGRRWFYALGGAVAFSRIYVGQHFPLDCLVGSALGASEGWLVWRLGQRWFARSHVPEEPAA